MPRPIAALLVLAAASLLGMAAPAAALECDNLPLVDDEGITWRATNEIDGQSISANAYLHLLSPSFERGNRTYFYLPIGQRDSCTLEDGGREVRYPPVMVGDLEVSGTWYVPSGAPAFQRSLLILHNPHPEPAAATPFFNQETVWTDEDSLVVNTSSGDATADASDDWMVLQHGGVPADPRVGFLWNFGTDRRRSALEVYEYDSAFDSPTPPYTGGQDPTQRFGRTVVPPGGIVTFLAVGLARPDVAGAEATARELQAAPDLLLAGLSDDEKRGLQNVGLPDADLDGVANGADNCRFVVNADQANLDGDAEGDACDADVDGDGVGNDVEAARGSDQRRADTDGDGKADAVDACPLKAGLGPDGCARFDELPLAPDLAAPGATIRRLGATMKLRAFRRGVPCVVDLTEAAAVACRLLVRATRVARVAAAGDLEVAGRSLPLAPGRRSATLKPKRGLIRQRRFRATLQVTATDAAGNRTTKTKRFRVR